MARKLDDVMATLPKARKKRVEDRAMELATLKDLGHADFNDAALRGKHGRKAGTGSQVS